MPLSSIHGSVFWNEALWNKRKSGTLFSSIKYSWGACSFWIAILFSLCLNASALLVVRFEIYGTHSYNIGSCSYFHTIRSIKFLTEGKTISSISICMKKYVPLGPILELILLFQHDNSVYFCIFTVVHKLIILYWDVSFLP